VFFKEPIYKNLVLSKQFFSSAANHSTGCGLKNDPTRKMLLLGNTQNFIHHNMAAVKQNVKKEKKKIN